MTTDPVRAGTPSDNTTLTAVLADLERDGYGASFGAREGARLHCSECGEESPVADLTVEATRRLEGASDPDAQTIVVAAVCPRCGSRGTAALGYGPEAAVTDADVVADLNLS